MQHVRKDSTKNMVRCELNSAPAPIKLKDYIRNTTAVCGNITTVGYNYVRTNSDHLHVRGELFGQIGSSSSLSGIYIPQRNSHKMIARYAESKVT